MDSTMRKTPLLVLASCMLTAAAAVPDAGRDIAQKSQAALFTYKTLKASGEMTLTRGVHGPAEVHVVLMKVGGNGC